MWQRYEEKSKGAHLKELTMAQRFPHSMVNILEGSDVTYENSSNKLDSI